MTDDPRPDFLPDWQTCDVPNCRGIRIAAKCLQHSSHADEFLAGLEPGADLDLRGTELGPDLLMQILRRVSHRDAREPVFGTARFNHVWFRGDAKFDLARFNQYARFDNASFSGNVRFSGASFEFGVSFVGARFDSATSLGPMRAHELRLDNASFAKFVTVGAEGCGMTCIGTQFIGGAMLRLNSSDVDASEATFGAASAIRGDLRQLLPRVESTRRGGARLESLRGVDTSNLVLSDMDLRYCVFDGAHRLDQLRIEGFCHFETPPAGWRWTWRQVLAEEARYRGWSSSIALRLAGDVGPERLAGTYRALRKSFEDSKNEAEAGDFYYGEMEMRRRSPTTSPAVRWILTFYWLLSGYGQRASRALAALLVLVTVVTVLLWQWGQGFLVSARTAIGAVVFRGSGTKLTEAGEWTVLTARFLGPVLLALAVLAVRARVKR